MATFFDSLGNRNSNGGVTTTAFDLGELGQARVSRAVATASVALVDASLDLLEALDVCQQLRARRADLRIGILFCCPHAATAASLRPFLDAGICSFLDLQLSAEQTLAALRSIARGEDVVRLQLSEEASTALFGNHGKDEQLSSDDLLLMHLVALGLTDAEIGLEMCLSRHTIKHRIERLCRRQNARNRVQLAAIAGRLERVRGIRLTQPARPL
ncbi:MAG TPA: LuxR C-terminal-related transcriptional regulator [Solirubrobacteraceae bacterium]